MRPRPPRLARLLLRLRPLGDRRADVEADLRELFAARVAAHGARHARRRYLVDVLSLWRRPVPVRARTFSRPVLSSGLLQDAAYALRLFRRQPGIVATAIVGLALAIGAGTAAFSLLNAAVLRPIGVAEPDATVTVWRRHDGGASVFWPYSEFLDLRARVRSARIDAWRAHVMTLETAGGRTPVTVHLVTGGFFETFGGRTLHGRVLAPIDDAPGAHIVAVLSDVSWKRQFGTDPAIVGMTIALDGLQVPIVGVAARHFTGPVAEGAPVAWLALTPSLAAWPTRIAPPPATEPSVRMSGVVRDGVSAQQAQAEVSAIAAALGLERVTADARPATAAEFVDADNRGDALHQLTAIVLVVIALVLVLACANVANLLLAGATTRGREIGMRLALGASQLRIARQLLTESLLLGVAAGALGLACAIWLVPVLASLTQLPPEIDVAPDGRVFAFVLTVTLFAGLSSGLAPARHGLRGALLRPIKSDGAHAGASRPTARLRSVFVAAQAAASLVLVVLAALLGRGLLHASTVDPGFDLDRLAGVSATFPRGYDDARRRELGHGIVERVRSLPGVEAVGLVTFAPGQPRPPLTTAARDGAPYAVDRNLASADYFAAAGHRFVRGRTFTAAEEGAGAVAVITSNLADDFWGPADPIGETLERIDDALGQTRIVGVIEPALTAGLQRPPPATVYEPFRWSGLNTIVVRLRGDVAAALPLLRDAVHAVDPTLRPNVWPLRRPFEKELERGRVLATLAALAGGLALLLSVLGITGVTAFAVGQRRREIGLRMAIGATAGDVVADVVRDGLRPVVAGLSVGLAIAVLSSHVVASVLYGISARDPLAMMVAMLVLLGAATAAVIVPARRVAAVDPARVLRE